MTERFDRPSDRRNPEKQTTTPTKERRTGRDRRRNTRISLSFDIAMPVTLRGDFGVLTGLARNISEGGLLVETRQGIPIGARLEIVIQGVHGSSDAPEPLLLMGEVRHQLAWEHIKNEKRQVIKGVGIRFLWEEQKAQQPLSHWIWKTGYTMH